MLYYTQQKEKERTTMIIKTFYDEESAKVFVKKNQGFIEGPFIDEKLEVSFIVFFKYEH
jgi:hypothetical protein